MTSTIGEYIEQDANFWNMSNTTYKYVYVDIEQDNEEVLVASYHSTFGTLDWEDNKYSRYVAMNEPCAYVECNRYTYGDGIPDYVDVLMYPIPEEEIKNFNV